MAATGTVRIGISGWRYPPWRGIFYPPKLPQKRELAYAANIFRSIEINGTFYSLQRPEYFEAWAAETPDDFVFSVKGPRFITHIKRLKDVKVPLANFLASGVLRLGPKFGPILWQFPPNFRFEPKKLETFLKMLPHDTEAAAALARRHDKRLSGRSALKTDAKRQLRHAIEVRHNSFVTPAFVQLLRKYDVALVCADAVEWPRLMDLTSDFVYCRLHGSEQLYASGYDQEALDRWAARVACWAQGKIPADAEQIIKGGPSETQPRDVFVYFDNDTKVRAPFDAQGFMARISEIWKRQPA
jgi:uncharacterized protein YecE (DUF72 family)